MAMFRQFFEAIRHKDSVADPITSQISEAREANEVARARAEQTLCDVFDRPNEGCTGVLKVATR